MVSYVSRLVNKPVDWSEDKPATQSVKYFSSVQFKVVSVRLENYLCAPSCLPDDSQTLPLHQF